MRKGKSTGKEHRPETVAEQIRLEPAEEARVVHKDLPRRPTEDKQIHPRRPLPAVPDKGGKSGRG
jgi:hypothetical protein